MLANVWRVIWPNQKIVIASAVAAATGGRRTRRRRRRGVARSSPLAPTSFLRPDAVLHGAATHMPPNPITHLMGYWIGVLIVAAVIEINASRRPPVPPRSRSRRSGLITTGFVVWRWCTRSCSSS